MMAMFLGLQKNNMKNVCWLYCPYVDDCIAI